MLKMIFNGLDRFISKYVFLKNYLVDVIKGVESSNKMHQGENYQDFLKLGGVFLGHSLIIIK